MHRPLGRLGVLRGKAAIANHSSARRSMPDRPAVQGKAGPAIGPTAVPRDPIDLGGPMCPMGPEGLGSEVMVTSLCLDPKLPDERPPFLDLGLLHCAERLRRLLLARENLIPDIGKPRWHRRIG